jgi:hypothetical protein
VDAKRAPLVVDVHGGPYNQVKPEFSLRAQFLANRGYIVFSPNFRASTGYGRRYVLSSAGDFGGNGVGPARPRRRHALAARPMASATRNASASPARPTAVTPTLLGLTFQPELFKVGVASVPPSDFAFVMREYLGTGKEFTPGVPMAGDHAPPGHRSVQPAADGQAARASPRSPTWRRCAGRCCCSPAARMTGFRSAASPTTPRA